MLCVWYVVYLLYTVCVCVYGMCYVVCVVSGVYMVYGVCLWYRVCAWVNALACLFVEIRQNLRCLSLQLSSLWL